MISLNKEQSCVLELVKASLFASVPVISENIDWEKVFELAKNQCIVPLISSCVPKDKEIDWLVISCQSKAHFIQVLYEQDSLVKLLNTNGIPFVIFKGTAAAVYYPIPSKRTFGDIDFFVSADLFSSAKFLLEHNGYRFVDKNERHYSYVKNGIEFELHNTISSIHYKNIDNIYFNGLNNYIDYKIGAYIFPGLPTYENGIVLLGHIVAHLKQSGIGLRQIIDWMMFVNKELDDSAWDNTFRLLALEAGFEKIAITVTYMCKKWLGLPNEITWCNVADEALAEQLLLRIMDDGNFGQNRALSESIIESMKKEGVFKFLQRVGILNWPMAQRYAVLRPFAWLYQLFIYAGKGIIGFFTGKRVLNTNKQNMSLEDLLERLE